MDMSRDESDSAGSKEGPREIQSADLLGMAKVEASRPVDDDLDTKSKEKTDYHARKTVDRGPVRHIAPH